MALRRGGILFLVAFTAAVLFLAPGVRSQRTPNPHPDNAIARVQIRYDGDVQSFTVNFVDTPPVRVIYNCFTDKLVFTDGNTTFTPRYPGRCSYAGGTILVSLNVRDYHRFIQAGLATRPYPNLSVYTNDKASEGEFPLQPILPESPLVATYIIRSPSRFSSAVSYTAPQLFREEGVLLFHFNTFVLLSSLDLSEQVWLGRRESRINYYGVTEINSNYSVSLKGAEILTTASDDLAISIALRLTSEQRLLMRERGICTGHSSDCKLLVGAKPDFVKSFSGFNVGRPTVRYGSLIPTIKPNVTKATMMIALGFIGYSIQVTLPNGYAFHLYSITSGGLGRLTRVQCHADGVDHVNPELFLNGRPINDQYLTRNWPTEITLSADKGISNENLLGYYTCKTQNDSSTSSHIIHTYDFFHIIDGESFSVEYNGSLTFRVAQNFLGYDFHYFLSIKKSDGEDPEFEYDMAISQTIPNVLEVHLFNLRFSDAGRYVIDITEFYIPADSRDFVITVNPPRLSVTHPVLAVSSTDTRVTLTCTTSHEHIGTAWLVSGQASPVVYSATNTLKLDITGEDISQLDGTLYECVVYDPDVLEPTIISRAGTVLRRVSEPISLVTEESGVRTEHKPDEFVKSSHFECLGHIPSGAVDLYWSLFSREMKMETNITRDLSNNDFIATVHDNYLTLTILGRFVGTVSCKSRASSDEIRVDVLTTDPIDGQDYIQFLNISTNYTGLVTDTDDGCSRVVHISNGLPFGAATQTFVHVCANGLLTVGSLPVRFYEGSHFPSSNTRISQSNVLAPFWNDHDARDSDIFYRVYSSSVSKSELEYVSRFISSQQSSEFQGTWMIVAHWEDIPAFPHTAMGPTNTFQTILITDGTSSYAVYTYSCGSLGWGQSVNGIYSLIGYNIDQESAAFSDLPSFANHRLSGLPNVESIACGNIKRGTRSTNVIYKVGESKDVAQLSRAECLRAASTDDVLEFASSRLLTRCPCTRAQALRNPAFRRVDMFEVTVDPDYLQYDCYVRRIHPDTFLSLCCFEVRSGALSDANGVTTLLRYSPVSRTQDFLDYDHHLRRNCLVGGILSEQYRAIRPSLTCEDYQPPEIIWMVGDPHLTSLDGANFTFNGWGEYLLLQSSGERTQFELQARTEPVSGSTATQLVALAFAMEKHSPVEVRLGSGCLEVYLNGTNYTDTLATTNDTFSNDFMSITCTSPDSILVTFSNEFGVVINSSNTMLSFTTTVPDAAREKTRGLMGNYNGVVEDDIMFRNGTVVMENVDDRLIHEVGQSWQLLEGESLFTYPEGRTYLDYAHPDHVPVSPDEVVAIATPEVLAACGTNKECIFDAVETGDISVGLETMGTIETNLADEAEASNSPPTIAGPNHLIVTLFQEAVLNFNVTDDKDLALIDVEAVNGLPTGADLRSSVEGNHLQYIFRWTPTEVENVSLVFMATDELEAASILTVQVVICACRNHGNCTLDGVLSTSDSTLIMNCECPQGWEGTYCEVDTDGCDNFDCFEGVECEDVPAPGVGAVCGPCPDGYHGDGAKCVDVDECSTDNGGCVDRCVNLPGSFRCECNHGYQLINSTHCEDINECLVLNGGCHQICTNSEGSFSCSCDDSFFLSTENNRTCEVEPSSACDEDTLCEQTCMKLNGTNVCGCYHGYQLAADGVSCVDVEECAQPGSPCDQLCLNLEGGYRCGCREGYELMEDGRCEEINECMKAAVDETDLCDPSMFCVNTVGGYVCECPGGTVRMGEKCVRTPEPVVDCRAKADRGDCKGFIPRFFFNQRTGRCEVFLYGGCRGNGNNYESLEECTNTCNPKECPPYCTAEYCTAKATRRSLCTLPETANKECNTKCHVTYCHVCYYDNKYRPLHQSCKACTLTDVEQQSKCFKRWATCTRRADGGLYPKLRSRDRTQDLFKCYEHPCV